MPVASGRVHLAASCALGSAEAPSCGCSLALGLGELLGGFGSIRAGSSEQVAQRPLWVYFVKPKVGLENVTWHSWCCSRARLSRASRDPMVLGSAAILHGFHETRENKS